VTIADRRRDGSWLGDTVSPGKLQKRLTVVDAPSALGLRPSPGGQVPGTHGAPAVLRRLGLVERLKASDSGAVPLASYNLESSAAGEMRNEHEIRLHSIALADRLGELLTEGDFPVVVGGDCSILIGICLALRRRGRYALASLDGLDYRHPGNTPAEQMGAAAGESLALVTGRGGPLADIEGLRPYMRAEDVIALGVRSGDGYLASAISDGITVLTVPELVADPAQVLIVARQAVARADAGFWIHLDVDVIDPTLMPAVDSPEPGGLDHQTLVSVVRRLAAVSGAVGLDVTIYDPDRDPGLEHGREVVQLLASILADGVA
jgi:arginase